MARPRLEQPNFNLRRLGTGIFHIQWTANGRTRSRTTGTRNKDAATAHLDRFIAAFDKPSLPKKTTVAEIVAAFLKVKSKKVHAPKTLKYSAAPIIKHMGNLLAENVCDSDAERYAKIRNRAPGTIIRELGVLKAAGVWSVNQKILKHPITFAMPVTPAAPKDRWITKAEAAHLLKTITAPHLKLFVLLALGTAARSGAILNLTWNQIDFGGGLINFGQGRGKKRRAIVPMNDNLRTALESAQPFSTSKYVVEYGGKQINTIKNGFAEAVKKAALPAVTPHTLRHTAATWMMMNGISLSKVARYLGDTEKTVERVYGHHAPDYLKEAANALNF